MWSSLGEEFKLDDDALADALENTGPDAEAIHVTAFLDDDDDRRIAYSTDVGSVDMAVVAEAQLTSPRISEDREGEAFDGIDVAIYLGEDESPDALLTSTTPDLPIDGRRAERTVPIGDTSLLFVVTPAGTLGGGLLALLPWLAAAAGLLSGGIGAVLVESLHRRRVDAETFTEEWTISIGASTPSPTPSSTASFRRTSTSCATSRSVPATSRGPRAPRSGAIGTTSSTTATGPSRLSSATWSGEA